MLAVGRQACARKGRLRGEGSPFASAAMAALVEQREAAFGPLARLAARLAAIGGGSRLPTSSAEVRVPVLAVGRQACARKGRLRAVKARHLPRQPWRRWWSRVFGPLARLRGWPRGWPRSE